MRRGFTLVELLISITIIGILSSIGLNTFTSSQIKGRDAKRKAYLRQIGNAIETYYNDKGEFPNDNGSGSILGCGVGAAQVCTWGTSAFKNDTNGTTYMVQLPEDPTQGLVFYYDATRVSGKYTKYQLYARLENDKDVDLNKDADGNMQVFQGLACGTKTCNYGISSTNIMPEEGRTLVTE